MSLIYYCDCNISIQIFIHTHVHSCINVRELIVDVFFLGGTLKRIEKHLNKTSYFTRIGGCATGADCAGSMTVYREYTYIHTTITY